MPIDKATPTDPHVNPDPGDGSYPVRPGLIPGTLIGDTIPVDRGQSEAHERAEVRVTHNPIDRDAEAAAQDNIDAETKAANANAKKAADDEAAQDKADKEAAEATATGRAGTHVKDQYHEELVAGHGHDVDITESGEPVHDPGTDLYVYEEENEEAGTTTGTTGWGPEAKRFGDGKIPKTRHGVRVEDEPAKMTAVDDDTSDDDDDVEYVTMSNTRDEINEAARDAGVDNPEGLPSKEAVLDAINAAG